MTVAEIDAGIAALVTALGSGELKVRFSDGREVTYNSAADISARLRALRLERDAVIAGAFTPGIRMRSFPIVMRRD
jgi:hypothetical protein